MTYDKTIVDVFIEMDSNKLYHHWDEDGNRACPLGPEKLAFFMRDKCDETKLNLALFDIWEEYGTYVNPFQDWIWFNATPEQWIRAACAAWRSK